MLRSRIANETASEKEITYITDEQRVLAEKCNLPFLFTDNWQLTTKAHVILFLQISVKNLSFGKSPLRIAQRGNSQKGGLSKEPGAADRL